MADWKALRYVRGTNCMVGTVQLYSQPDWRKSSSTSLQCFRDTVIQFRYDSQYCDWPTVCKLSFRSHSCSDLQPHFSPGDRCEIQANFTLHSRRLEGHSGADPDNIGLRWDYFPPYHEVQNRLSWMDSTKINPLVGIPGAVVLQEMCRTDPSGTNVQNYFKNIGPRLAFAYASDPNTVWRGSFSVVYTHGDAVGGNSISNQGSGLLGYSVSPATTNITCPAAGLNRLDYPGALIRPTRLTNYHPTLTRPSARTIRRPVLIHRSLLLLPIHIMGNGLHNH